MSESEDKALLALVAFVGILSCISIYLSSMNLNQSNRIDQLKQDSIICHKVIREQNTILKNVHKNCVVMGE